MATQINVYEAKTRLSALLDRVAAGEEVIIAKAGKPFARLVAIKEQGPRIPGLAKGRLTRAFFDPLPEEELAAWETLKEGRSGDDDIPTRQGAVAGPLARDGAKD